MKNKNQLEYELSTEVNVTPQQQHDRLIKLGTGIYRDKISGKILYKYDEMPAAEVVGHKKKKSVNDNWQKAYAKGVPSGTMASDMETMNAVTGGALSWTMPSQLVGATGRLINDGDFGQFGRNLILGNNGIVTDKFAQEHPWYSLGANIIFDGFSLRNTRNINYFNKRTTLPIAIVKGTLKTAVEPFQYIDFGYVNDAAHPIRTIKAIRDGRYVPLFKNKAQARVALSENNKKLHKMFDDAYNFNKKIEESKAQPVNIDEQYTTNSNNWDFTSENVDWRDYPKRNTQPELHIDPLKNDNGQKFYDADAFYKWNDVYVPSRVSKHVLTDPNSFKTRLTLAHEANHHMQNIIPKYRSIGVWNDGIEEYIINPDDELASKVFKPIKHNSSLKFTSWSGSPYEAQSEMAGLQYVLNNPSNYASQPWYNKLFMNQHMSRKFNMFPWQTHKMLNDMSKYSFAKGGKFNK